MLGYAHVQSQLQGLQGILFCDPEWRQGKLGVVHRPLQGCEFVLFPGYQGSSQSSQAKRMGKLGEGIAASSELEVNVSSMGHFFFFRAAFLSPNEVGCSVNGSGLSACLEASLLAVGPGQVGESSLRAIVVSFLRLHN